LIGHADSNASSRYPSRPFRAADQELGIWKADTFHLNNSSAAMRGCSIVFRDQLLTRRPEMSMHSIEAWRDSVWTPTWSLQVFVAATFFATGVIKLIGAPFMVQMFTQIGFGQWLRVVTGIVEIIGAFAVVYPGLASIGGLWLGTTMVCAVLTHLFVLHSNPALALFLGALNAAIVYLHRRELVSYAQLVTQCE
jgi:hypothetical protein